MYIKIMMQKQKFDPPQTHDTNKFLFISKIDENNLGDITVSVFAVALLIINAFIVFAFNNTEPQKVNIYPNYLVIFL